MPIVVLLSWSSEVILLVFRSLLAASIPGMLLLASVTSAKADEVSNPAPSTEVTSHKAGAYATVGLGATFPQNINWDASSLTGSAAQGTSFVTELGVGYDFGNNIRTELTYGYANQPVNQITASGRFNNTNYNASLPLATTYNASTFLLSGYYDIPTKSRFVPYVGGGIGIGVDTISAKSVILGADQLAIQSSTGTTFAYQAKIGVSYFVDKKTDLFVEGVYQGNTGFATTASIGNLSTTLNLGSNSDFGFRAGARFRF